VIGRGDGKSGFKGESGMQYLQRTEVFSPCPD
jgi:hypothetical protein